MSGRDAAIGMDSRRFIGLTGNLVGQRLRLCLDDGEGH